MFHVHYSKLFIYYERSCKSRYGLGITATQGSTPSCENIGSPLSLNGGKCFRQRDALSLIPPTVFGRVTGSSRSVRNCLVRLRDSCCSCLRLIGQMVAFCNRLRLSHLAVNDSVIVNGEVSVCLALHVCKAPVPLIDGHIGRVKFAETALRPCVNHLAVHGRLSV